MNLTFTGHLLCADHAVAVLSRIHVCDRGQATGDEGLERLGRRPASRWQSDRCEGRLTLCFSRCRHKLFERAVESPLESSSSAMITFATYS